MANQISKVSDNLVKVIKILLFALPVIFLGLFEVFLYPYVSTKVFIFRALVELLAFLYVWLILLDKKYYPKKTVLFFLLLGYIGIQFLSSIIGGNFYRSFWGNFERMDGLITQLHYFAYFVILISVLKDKKDWHKLFLVSLSVGFILILVGFLQKIGVQLYTKDVQGRISGSFGNPAYFASYLIFQIFLSLYFFTQEKNKWHWVYLFYFILGTLVIFLTETRGAIIGWGIGLAVYFFLILLFNEKKQLRKYIVVPIVVLLIVSSMFYFLRSQPFMHKIGFLNRLSSISLADNTSRTRLLIWQIAGQGFVEKPILGWGWGNFEMIFNKYYNPQLFDQETWFDHSHNNFLDILTSTGLLGFATYLGILLATVIYLFRSWKQKKIDYKVFSVFVALFVAYLGQNLFIFDMVGSYVNFYILLAFICFLYVGDGQDIIPSQNQNKQKIKMPSAAIVMLAFTLICFYFVNWKPAKASYYATTAWKYSAASAFNQAYTENLIKALSYGTFGKAEIRFQMILDHLKSLLDKPIEGDNKQQVVDLSNLAIKEFTQAIEEEPNNLRNYVALAYVYLMDGKIETNKGPEFFQKSLDLLGLGGKMSPKKQDLYFLRAEDYVGLNKIDEAIKVLEAAKELDPSFIDPHLNILKVATFGEMNDKVMAELAEMDRSGLKLDIAGYESLINTAASKNNFVLLVEYYKRIIILDSSNPKYHAGLAAVYAAVGNNKLAEEEARQAMASDPGFVEEGKQFLEMLKQGQLKKK